MMGLEKEVFNEIKNLLIIKSKIDRVDTNMNNYSKIE